MTRRGDQGQVCPASPGPDTLKHLGGSLEEVRSNDLNVTAKSGSCFFERLFQFRLPGKQRELSVEHVY